MIKEPKCENMEKVHSVTRKHIFPLSPKHIRTHSLALTLKPYAASKTSSTVTFQGLKHYFLK